MTNNVTLLRPVRTANWCIKAAGAMLALAMLPAPLLAAEQQDDEEEESKVVTDESVDAKDVALTPLSDLNLKKDPIPQLLLDAQAAPYDTDGLRYCRNYEAAVLELDTVLGDDYDLVDPEGHKLEAGRVAQSVVGALIPFRGVIRELSGANKHEREFRDAIVAGIMRRSYLKGMGLKLGCEYPARPATEEIRQRIMAEREEARLAAEAAEQDEKDRERSEKERERAEKEAREQAEKEERRLRREREDEERRRKREEDDRKHNQ
jgi:hypothetical protein